jgi:hypothetical protein
LSPLFTLVGLLAAESKFQQCPCPKDLRQSCKFA